MKLKLKIIIILFIKIKLIINGQNKRPLKKKKRVTL